MMEGMKMLQKYILFIFLFFTLVTANIVRAQEIVPDKTTIVRAQVEEILDQSIKEVSDTKLDTQSLKAKILEGDEVGKEITFQNDYMMLTPGEVFYLAHETGKLDGRDVYYVSEVYRLPAIYFFLGLFLLCVFFFGGMQGARGLFSLVLSLACILFWFLPGILNGGSPLFLSIGVSSLVVVLGSYVTHGFNKTTSSAVLGMLFTVIITGLLAFGAIHFARLGGLETEEAVYLNLNTKGIIDFQMLLLGSMIIGLLGILYDTAITQAIAVEELNSVAPNLPKKMIYKRAIRMGREHIGALVNTLAIAYVGVSLPMLLYVYPSYQNDWGMMANQAIFATEIMRILIGSIGLMLAVPVTTFVAVFILMKHSKKQSVEVLEKEMEALEQVKHSH